MDILLVFTQLTLGMLGVLGIATSEADSTLVIRHSLAICGGLFLSFLVSLVPPRTILRSGKWLYLGALALLILVLFIGITPIASEGKRWIDFGFFRLQPSELMKVAMITYLVSFFHDHHKGYKLWKPMLVVGVAIFLIMLEPNFSTALFIFALALAVMMISGAALKELFAIATLSSLTAILLTLAVSNRYAYFFERITTFLNKDEDPFGSGYQAFQATRTLIKSGFFGVGPGTPISVPEAHTDMIAISIAQALGLTGIITLVVLYIFIAGRGFRLASLSVGAGGLLAAGATAYICGQASLNLLVASGWLPVTGVVLPFVSHGLNSLISVSIAIGFMHSAYRHAKRQGIHV